MRDRFTINVNYRYLSLSFLPARSIGGLTEHQWCWLLFWDNDKGFPFLQSLFWQIKAIFSTTNYHPKKKKALAGYPREGFI
jgi:hypothetical protein